MLGLHKPFRESPADPEAASEKHAVLTGHPIRWVVLPEIGCESSAKVERGEKKMLPRDLKIRMWLFAKV